MAVTHMSSHIFCKLKFQYEFVHLEQPTICTCGLTNVGQVNWHNKPVSAI